MVKGRGVALEEAKLKGKKGIFLGFTGIRLVSFIISALVFIVLAVIAFTLFNLLTSTEEKAQALAFLDDITSKIRQLEKNPDDFPTNLKSVGALEKNVILKVNNNYAHRHCETNNNCLCLCKKEDCAEVIRCKVFKKEIDFGGVTGECRGSLKIEKSGEKIKITGSCD